MYVRINLMSEVTYISSQIDLSPKFFAYLTKFTHLQSQTTPAQYQLKY